MGAALLPLTGHRHAGLALSLLWLAVVLTLVTGPQYLLDGRRMPPHGRRRPADRSGPARRRLRWPAVRCEVVAVGTELLLGQIVDTNSAWIGEQLALAGIDSHFQVKVGDNHARIVLALREALARSDAVICCGGLGPTQDDITREAIAEVMNVDARAATTRWSTSSGPCSRPGAGR